MQPPSAESTAERCPTCSSSAPHLHPTTEDGRELWCHDYFHATITAENTPARVSALAAHLRAQGDEKFKQGLRKGKRVGRIYMSVHTALIVASLIHGRMMWIAITIGSFVLVQLYFIFSYLHVIQKYPDVSEHIDAAMTNDDDDDTTKK